MSFSKSKRFSYSAPLFVKDNVDINSEDLTKNVKNVLVREDIPKNKSYVQKSVIKDDGKHKSRSSTNGKNSENTMNHDTPRHPSLSSEKIQKKQDLGNGNKKDSPLNAINKMNQRVRLNTTFNACLEISDTLFEDAQFDNSMTWDSIEVELERIEQEGKHLGTDIKDLRERTSEVDLLLNGGGNLNGKQMSDVLAQVNCSLNKIQDKIEELYEKTVSKINYETERKLNMFFKEINTSNQKFLKEVKQKCSNTIKNLNHTVNEALRKNVDHQDEKTEDSFHINTKDLKIAVNVSKPEQLENNERFNEYLNSSLVEDINKKDIEFNFSTSFCSTPVKIKSVTCSKKDGPLKKNTKNINKKVRFNDTFTVNVCDKDDNCVKIEEKNICSHENNSFLSGSDAKEAIFDTSLSWDHYETELQGKHKYELKEDSGEVNKIPDKNLLEGNSDQWKTSDMLRKVKEYMNKTGNNINQLFGETVSRTNNFKSVIVNKLPHQFCWRKQLDNAEPNYLILLEEANKKITKQSALISSLREVIDAYDMEEKLRSVLDVQKKQEPKRKKNTKQSRRTNNLRR